MARPDNLLTNRERAKQSKQHKRGNVLRAYCGCDGAQNIDKTGPKCPNCGRKTARTRLKKPYPPL